MEATGRIQELLQTMEGKGRIVLELEDAAALPPDLQTLANLARCKIKITPYREKRSKDANALLWHCIGQIQQAYANGITKEEIYLQLLRKYGTYDVLSCVPEAIDHLRRVFRTVEDVGPLPNGNRQVLGFYGSSDYDTKEMSVLLDGVISDMTEMGIETPASADMEHALQLWEEQYG